MVGDKVSDGGLAAGGEIRKRPGKSKAVLRIQGSGAFLTLGSGMEKNSYPGSGMHIPDHFFESLETVFRVSGAGLRNLFDPGSGMEKFGSGSRDKHTGSATLVGDRVSLAISWKTSF
jgi:hypothetical protein